MPGDQRCSKCSKWYFSCRGQRTRVKTLEAISLRLTQEFCGCCSLTLRVSAIRLSSGSELAFIFRIRWVRCTFTVDLSDADVVGNLFV